MQYELIIFDNDGVLVDSEPISNRILADLLTEIGHPTTYEDSVRDFMGGAEHRIHDVIRERTGQRLPEGFDEELRRRVFAAFEQGLEAVTGVEDVLEKVAADGAQYCLASSGTHERIKVALCRTGLSGRFGHGRIFSAEDVGRGKPAPDLFLRAAEVMGVDPRRCAVVEDSPLGVGAARAAGMDVFGFTAMTPAERLAEATGLFRRMADLPGLLFR